MLSVSDFNPDDIARVLKIYGENYEWLYDHYDAPSGLDSALTRAGDLAIKSNPEFASVFCEMRGDFMTSDREVAAFAMTFPHLITLETVEG